MASLAAVKERRSTFVEEKTLAALDAPVTSHGTLAFKAPAYLEKRTAGPVPETLIVDGGELTYEKPQEGSRQRLSLDRVPELRGLVEAVRGTLAGDRAALQRFYSIGLDSDANGWRLTLVPLDDRLRGVLRFVRIEGRAAELLQVFTVEADGDSTRMTVTPQPVPPPA